MEESVKECSQLSSGTCKELENLKEIMKKRDEELNLLRNEKDQLSKMVKIQALKLQDSERRSKAEREFLIGQMEFKPSVFEKFKEQYENLQQIDEYQLDRTKSADHNANGLHQDIRNLQENLKMEQQANQRYKEELSKVMIKCEKLQVDYDRVTKLLEVSRYEREKLEKLQTLSVSKEKGYCEHIDRLTAQLLEVQDQLDERNAVIKDLKEKLSLVAEESENIPALKAEILVHRSDLMSSMTTCNIYKDKVARLNQELEKYQKQPDSVSRVQVYRSDESV